MRYPPALPLSLLNYEFLTFTMPSPFDYIPLSPTIRFRFKELIHMKTQRIETGTPDSDALGFSERLFSGWLDRYEDNRLYLHFIISREKNEGHTQALLRQWLSEGYDVRVVMPRPIMQHILKKFQFIASIERLPDHYENDVEVWYRPVIRHDYTVPIQPAIHAETG